MGEGEVDEAQTTPFAEGVGILVLVKNFVAGLHALEAAIFKLLECRRAQKVCPFLLLSLLFRRRHGIVSAGAPSALLSKLSLSLSLSVCRRKAARERA